MSLPDAIEVEVEFVLDGPGKECLVVVRPLFTPIPIFTVTSQTTLGGAPVKGLGMPPRMCGVDGTPRGGLLAFRVRGRDCRRLGLGARVSLAGLHVLD